MNLLLLNDTYFGPALEEADVQVLRMGPGEDNDIVVDPDTDDIAELIEKLPFRPDAVLQVDSIDQRVFFKGLEKIDAPRAFYAIDSPINDFWQRDFASMFDLVWVDQAETVDAWRKDGINWVQWLPLAADRTVYFAPDDEQERDLEIVFVGTMDFAHRPKRSAILHRLRQVAEVTLVDGGGTRSVPPEEVAAYYRRAKLVLNELLFDGINLRSFEAMACGAVLLTEEGRGEERLFGDGEQLVTFNSANLEEVVRERLADSGKLREIGDRAAESIRAHHSISTRAKKVLRELAGLKRRPKRDSDEQRVRAAWGVWMASWKWDHLREFRHNAAELLVDQFAQLDPASQTTFLEGVGEAEQARDFLKHLLEMGQASPTLKPTLASLALSIGDDDTARTALDMPDADRITLHLATGDRLMALGHQLTPGFNRMRAPRSSWTAFEHFQLVHSMDESNRAALDGMDKVLSRNHASEFMLPLWQRYHSLNPKQEDVQRLMIRRAQSGYFLAGKPGKRAGQSPLASTRTTMPTTATSTPRRRSLVG